MRSTRTGIRRARTWAAVVAGAAVALGVGLVVGLPASQASTPGVTGYRVVTGTPGDLPVGNFLVTVTASCPAGQSVVAGGMFAHSPLTVAVASYPDSATSWTVRVALNNTLGFTEHVTPYAVCVDTASVPGLHIATASAAVSNTDVNPSSGIAGEGIVDAFCSTGEYVLSGGFLSSSSGMLPSISIWLDGDTRAWQVGAFNTDSAHINTLSAYAVCVPQGDVTDYVQQHGDINSFGAYLNQPVAGSATAGTNTAGAPYCPNGDLAVGGGAFNHDNQTGNAFISSLIPAPGGDPHYWNETSIDLNPPSYGEWAAGYDICVNGSVAPIATTTTLVINPPSPSFNQTVTLTATVSPHPGPTGTVTFYDNGVAIGTGTVDSNGVATLTTTFGGGSHSLVATYGGDSTYAGSSSSPVTFTIACATTITGTHSSFTATSGLTCVVNAHITGGFTVSGGAQLDLENSLVSGSISAAGSGGLRICGSTFVSISEVASSGFVRIGDPANNCAPNHLTSLIAVNNSGGGAVIDNTITASWTITANNPAFTVAGNHH